MIQFSKLIFIIFYQIFITASCYSSEFSRPTALQFIKDVPSTLDTAWDLSLNKKNSTLLAWGGIFLSTGILYYYDEEILNEFQRFGRKVGIGNDDNTRGMIKLGSIDIFRGPTDLGSTLYFLGDGWTHTFIGLGFLTSGLVNDSNRAIATGSQIFNGMISSTIVNQIAKRSFGRESPYRKSKPRGAWRPFPSFSTYNNNISKYDAMPSGHLMTAAMTFTIIDENYPEYRNVIRPIAYTWMSLLGFQMINNAVHWASDYPLGIMMGYVFGKAASQKNRIHKNTNNWETLPIFYSDNGQRIYGINATLSI